MGVVAYAAGAKLLSRVNMPAPLVGIFESQQYQTHLLRAVDCLNQGKLVVLPTETIYGAAARLDRPEALRRLRELRPGDLGHPFTLHLPDRSKADHYLDPVSELGRRMMKKLWPGPVALIFNVSETRRRSVSGELAIEPSQIYADDAITLRCPDHVVAEDILSAVPAPVVMAALECDVDSLKSPAAQLAADLDDKIDLVIDAGPPTYAKPSTVVHVTGESYRIIRDGVYDERIIEKLLKTTILFVCSGNTCRSAMAEGLARKILSDKLSVGVDDLEKRGINVMSAGSFALAGAPAAAHAIDVLRDAGADLTRHRSRPLTIELIHQADRIYTMSQGHSQAVAALVPSAMEKVSPLDPAGDIEDPVGADMATYRHVAWHLKALIEQRLNESPVV